MTSHNKRMIFRGLDEIREKLNRSKPARIADLTIVIPCHNYGVYLHECLDSIAASEVLPARVIVIDDASDPPVAYLKPDGRPINVEQHRVEFRSLWRVCQFGFSMVDTRHVMFLDADDCIDSQYIGDAVRRLEADREAAFCFPTLKPFGDTKTQGPHWTEKAPQTIGWQDVEPHNWVPMSTVFRSELLRQSLALAGEIMIGCTLADWRMVRNVLRAGPWHGVRSARHLNYRQHPENDSKRPASYAVQASFSSEVVTVVVAFSGRWEAWSELHQWLITQTWPREQTRILILNSSHEALTAADFGIDREFFKSVQIERIDAGRPGLADEERVNAAETCRQVEAAVAGLYNYALQITPCEFVLFVEDDVIPSDGDTVLSLLSEMAPDVAAISGAYAHRYYPQQLVAFDLPYRGLPSLKSADGSAVEVIGGSGFGCLLIRRSVFTRFGLAGDHPTRPHYDCEISARIREAGYRWLLKRTVFCEHMTHLQNPAGRVSVK